MAGAFQSNAFQNNAFHAGGLSFSLDAVLLGSGSGSFSADAWVEITQAASFTADAVVLATPTGSFTADAVVLATQTGFSLDAVLLGSGSGSFSIDAAVVGVQNGSFTVDSTVLVVQSGSFTADAKVVVPITLDAAIRGLIFSDDFNRTVSGGLSDGNQGWSVYPWDAPLSETDYAVQSPDDAAAYVNPTYGAQIDSFFEPESYTGMPHIRRGVFQFDIWLDPSNLDLIVNIQGPTNYFSIWVGVGPQWHIDFYGGDWAFVPSEAAWYTAKWLISDFGEPQALKIWKVGDSEPDWLVTGNNPLTAGYASTLHHSLLSLYAYVDGLRNFKIYGTTPFTWAGNFWVAAKVVLPPGGTFTLNAIKLGPRTTSRTLRAIIVDYPVIGRFLLSAVIGKSISIDAAVAPYFRSNSVIQAGIESGFALHAEVWAAGTIVRTWPTIDAALALVGSGSFTIKSILEPLVSRPTSSKTIDAWVVGTRASFVAHAEIIDTLKEASFSVYSDILGANEKRGLIQVDAAIFLRSSVAFGASAYLIDWQYFYANAVVRPAIWLDSVVSKEATSSFALDAALSGIVLVDAVLLRSGSGTFLLDSDTANVGEVRQSFSLDSVLLSSPSGDVLVSANLIKAYQVTVDAYVGHRMSLDAFIQPYFSLQAYIRGADVILWQEDGAYDVTGTPVPSWFKASRKNRVQILIDDVDVTGDVIWAETFFTQRAKITAGQFQIAFASDQTFSGGEEVVLLVDYFRSFGGYVTEVERTYVFGDESVPKVYLRGPDYNILLDRLVVYRRDEASGSGGEYQNWPSFPKGTLDSDIIQTVMENYVDLPDDVDYTTYVDTVGSPAPVDRWALPTPGKKLRDTLLSVGRISNSIFFFDAYKNLHYHSRETITAPHPITDGYGGIGISSRGLKIRTDLSLLQNDVFAWGTLAFNVSGEIIVSREKDTASVQQYGLWQSAESSKPIHTQSYLDLRTEAVIDRYSEPINEVEATIFDPGYGAGMVTTVTSGKHGISVDLPIREIKISFPIIMEQVGGAYYSAPRYDLFLGIGPDGPWDIFEYIELPDVSYGWPLPRLPRLSSPPFCDNVTDSFNRAVATTGTSSWGVMSSGIGKWVFSGNSSPFTYGTDGSACYITYDTSVTGLGKMTAADAFIAKTGGWHYQHIRYEVWGTQSASATPGFPGAGQYWTIEEALETNQDGIGLFFNLRTGVLRLESQDPDIGYKTQISVNTGFTFSQRRKVHVWLEKFVEDDGETPIILVKANMWLAGQKEPTYPMLALQRRYVDPNFNLYLSLSTKADTLWGGTTQGTYTTYFENLDLNGVSGCFIYGGGWQIGDPVANGSMTATPVAPNTPQLSDNAKFHQDPDGTGVDPSLWTLNGTINAASKLPLPKGPQALASLVAGRPFALIMTNYNNGIFHSEFNSIDDPERFSFRYEEVEGVWKVAYEDFTGPKPPDLDNPGNSDVYLTIDVGRFEETGIYPYGVTPPAVAILEDASTVYAGKKTETLTVVNDRITLSYAPQTWSIEVYFNGRRLAYSDDWDYDPAYDDFQHLIISPVLGATFVTVIYDVATPRP